MYLAVNHSVYAAIILAIACLAACSTGQPSAVASDAECFSLPQRTHLPRLTATDGDLLLSFVFSGERDTLWLFKPAVYPDDQTSVALASGDPFGRSPRTTTYGGKR